jgi:hypothetical protein
MRGHDLKAVLAPVLGLEGVRERETKEGDAVVQTLTTILTVVTAIGAIWAALASTSQARASSVQARVADRGLEEQIRSFREQNEVARLSFEVDMMLKLEDRWESPTFLDIKRKAAKYLKAHSFTDDGGLLEVEHIDENTERLLGIFELLGDLVEQGVVRAETVWHRFGWRVRQYWALYRPAIEKMREEYKDPTLFEDFERLDALMADLDRQHGVGDEYIAKQQLRRTVEAESKALATEEAPTQEE